MKIEPNPDCIHRGDIKTLHFCDDLNDAVHYAEVLLEALMVTDFLEAADPNALRAYLFCVREKVVNALTVTGQLTDYLGH